MTSFFTISFLGGLLPALVWLWFWLRQDARCPEPRWLIAVGFIAGGISVAAALVLERMAAGIFTGAMLIVWWAAIEEVVKYLAAWFVMLRSRAYDEPVDALVYLITVALGFAAVENAFFLIKTFGDSSAVQTILTGNLRFIGATLLHVLASATIGAAIALTFYARTYVKRFATLAGVILAIVLHALFNLLIIRSNGDKLLLTFVIVWAGIIAVILAFEKAKRLRRRHNAVNHTTHHGTK